jgi:hypothetical protein
LCFLAVACWNERPVGAPHFAALVPELRVILEEAFDQAEEGTVYVINRYRDPYV